MFIKIETLFVFILLIFVSSCYSQNDVQEQQKGIESDNSTAINTFSMLADRTDKINQVVRTIFEDRKGTMWFGTESGAYKLSEDSLIFMNEIVSEYGKRVTIKSIAEGKDGSLWFGHTDGVTCIKDDKVKNYYESDGLISNDVWHVAADQHGKIWIGTIDGLCVFDGSAFSAFDLPEGERDYSLGVSSKEMVHNIFEDSKGTLWFCTNAGLFSYSDGALSHVSKDRGIETNFINEIFEDSKGQLWVSTKQGLYLLEGKQAINITKDKLEIGKGIGSIAEDGEGNLWFVSNQHFLFSCKQGVLTEFKKSEDNKGPVVFKIFNDQKNRLWFVGFGGAFRLEEGKFVHISQNGPW
jgi:ligand-binding sensor domain-containing protein